MRNIFILSQEIENCIPNTKEGLETRVLIKVLTKSYLYKAPEQWRTWYDSMSDLLTNRLGDPDTDWKIKISHIFGGR